MRATKKPADRRHHVTAGIVDTAASVLAADRDASVTDIATAAGVGRATLYRYFPTREALLRELATAGIEELGDRLAEAGLDTIPTREAVARLARAMVTTGCKYIALADLDPALLDCQAVEQRIMTPLRALLDRGITDGTFRDDFTPAILMPTFVGLVKTMIILSIRGGLGIEQASAAVTTLFLDGATPQSRVFRAGCTPA